MVQCALSDFVCSTHTHATCIWPHAMHDGGICGSVCSSNRKSTTNALICQNGAAKLKFGTKHTRYTRFEWTRNAFAAYFLFSSFWLILSENGVRDQCSQFHILISRSYGSAMYCFAAVNMDNVGTRIYMGENENVDAASTTIDSFILHLAELD